MNAILSLTFHTENETKKEIFSLNFVKRIFYMFLLLFITYVKRMDAVKTGENEQTISD